MHVWHCTHTRTHTRMLHACILAQARRAGYTLGASAQNQCPENSARIVDEPSCWRAATAVSGRFKGAESDAAYPRGCYLYQDPYDTRGLNGVWWNIHPVGGAGDQNSRLLCMSTTAAPTSRGFTYAPAGARIPSRVLRDFAAVPTCCNVGAPARLILMHVPCSRGDVHSDG